MNFYKKFLIVYILTLSFLFNQDNNRDCPDNFSVSPQSTPQETVCVPEQFVFNTTTQSAGYIFQAAIIEDVVLETSNCETANDCDWVGVFNGDVCVGATQWDVSACGNAACSINVMGNDYSENTPAGYMEPGDYPSFKIYDSSENIYYNAIPSENHPWANFGTYIIDELVSNRDIPNQFQHNVSPELAFAPIGSLFYSLLQRFSLFF